MRCTHPTRVAPNPIFANADTECSSCIYIENHTQLENENESDEEEIPIKLGGGNEYKKNSWFLLTHQDRHSV